MLSSCSVEIHIESPPCLPLPRKHPNLRPWSEFPSPETQTMVWVYPTLENAVSVVVWVLVWVLLGPWSELPQFTVVALIALENEFPHWEVRSSLKTSRWSSCRGLFQGGGGNGRGGIPHPGERYNVCPRWCRDTRTVTRVRHHLLC